MSRFDGAAAETTTSPRATGVRSASSTTRRGTCRTAWKGAPTGAGDGGYGPEGDCAGAAGQPSADVLGQVNADPDALIEEAQELGPPQAHRSSVDGTRRNTEQRARG